MNPDQKDFEGACHCGAVRFRAHFPNGLGHALRCNCTICRMRGATMAPTPLANFELTQGRDKLTLYQFNSNTAKHYFCSACGIYTHHQRRVDPTQYVVNVACLESVSPYDFAEVPVMDGHNHPADTGRPLGFAGAVKYVPTET